MSLALACAEVGAMIDRARSLFGAATESTPSVDAPAGQLSAASTATASSGNATTELAGEFVTAHREFATRSSGALSRAAGIDTALQSRMAAAAELTRTGADRLDALAQECRATARAATTASTTTSQRAVLTALSSQAHRTQQVVEDTLRRGAELAGEIRMLDYPLDTPPSAGDTPPDPNHLPESTLDGIHGTGTKDMPIITKPGELGPPNTGMFPGGTNWVEAVPGSGVWIPEDQISDKLWMPSYPGELAPPNYEEIAPDIWWPQPPAVDPGMEGPPLRGS